MKTILLTGASGFLGSHLLTKFIGEGYKVVVLKRSTSNLWRINDRIANVESYDIDQTDLNIVFKKVRIDIIVNTVCSYGRRDESVVDIVNSNLTFGLNLIEQGIKNNVRTFINTDSSLPRNTNEYSLSKAQLTDWLQLYANRIDIVNFRIEHMYGPKDDTTKFIPWLVNEMINGIGDINLTSGIQRRDFIHVEDVVNAYSLILKQSKQLNGYHQFDICKNELVEIKDLVLQIAERVRQAKDMDILERLKFGVIPYRANDLMFPDVNADRLLALGWNHTVGQKEGLDNYIDLLIKQNINK